MSHAKRVTKDNSKNPEYHFVPEIRKLRRDKNSPAEKPWPNHVKNDMSSKSDLKRPTAQSKHNDAKDRKLKCYRLT